MLALGTGVGIVVTGRDLEVAVVRLRPNQVTLLASGRVESFKERPASEWGKEYDAILAQAGAGSHPALVVLPPHEVVTRTVALPGVTDDDAPAAIGFQMESLHPFGDEEVYTDWQRAGRTATFAVVVARRAVVDSYIALFSEAGISVSGFTFAGSAVYRACRVGQAPAENGFVSVCGLNGGAQPPVLVYGESPTQPLLAAEFELPVERSAALAAAELRLDPETTPRDLIECLPRYTALGNADLSDAGRSRTALPYAAALASAAPHLGPVLNLLPPELRVARSRWVYAPTAVLALILLGLSVALLVQGRWIEKSYVARLEQEIARLEPVVKKSEAADRQSAQWMERISILSQFKQGPRADLDLLLELTANIPPPAFLTQLNITEDSVVLVGEAEQTEGLLKQLEASPLLANVEFAAPLSRNPISKREVFRVKGQREAKR